MANDTNPEARAPRKHRLGTLALMAFGLALGLVAGEIIVRLFFAEPILPRFVVDPGYGVRGNQADIVTHHYVPGDYHVKITTNSAGMRGPRDYAESKPPGVRRVALIGDSFIFGHGVNDDEVINTVAEDRLNGENAGTWQVLNFSVSGFGQAEQLVTYRHKTRDYSPDHVVLFYFNNDMGNNVVSGLFELRDDGSVERTGKEYLPGVDARELMYALPPIRWLFEHSQLWNLVRNRLSALVHSYLQEEAGIESYNKGNPRTERLTRALLLEFVDEIRADGAEPLLFIIPNKKLESNFPLDSQALEARDVTLIDGRRFLTNDNYHDLDGHWNTSGHRRAAERIIEALTSQH